QAEGYIERPVYWAAGERSRLQSVARGGTAEDRMRLVVTLGSAFQQDAGAAIEALDAGPVFTHAAALLAAGGSAETAELAFAGEPAVGERPLPPAADRQLRFDTLTDGAFDVSFDAEAARVRSRVLAMADAIYAAEAGGLDPRAATGDPEKAMIDYEKALQRALGRSTGPGGTVLGGAALIGAGKASATTLLPPDVAAVEVNEALETMADALRDDPDAFWRFVGDERPAFLNGDALDADAAARITLRAESDGLYALLIEGQNEMFELYAAGEARPFLIDLRAFMAAAQAWRAERREPKRGDRMRKK
ncbi:MAG: hypothetical protein AAF192_03900, partial [Pseudomonadota bacterium]